MASGDHQYTLMLAEKALEKIRALSLPADPSGYELWYSYAAGWHPEMNRQINRVLEENGSLPLSELGDIYDEYLSCSRLNAQADRTVTEISGEINSIVGMLGEFVVSTARDRNDCAKASQRLSQPADQDSIRAIADALVRSLRAVENRHAALEQRLTAAKLEMETLQQSLATSMVEANRDAITGLSNRRSFDKAIEEACSRADLGSFNFCLLMVDIDHFKNFNDRFGHLVGDSVLTLVASSLKQTIKGRDIVARFGGEEFAVILPDTTLQNAVKLSEQIRERIAGRELRKRSTGDSLAGLRYRSASPRTGPANGRARLSNALIPASTRPSVLAEIAQGTTSRFWACKVMLHERLTVRPRQPRQVRAALLPKLSRCQAKGTGIEPPERRAVQI